MTEFAIVMSHLIGTAIVFVALIGWLTNKPTDDVKIMLMFAIALYLGGIAL